MRYSRSLRRDSILRRRNGGPGVLTAVIGIFVCEVVSILEKNLRSKGIDFRPESYKWSVIQGLISRGDRRLSHLLELVRNYGDSLGSYKRAFKELRGELPELDFYVFNDWELEQVLPWNHIQGPLPKATLKKHLAETTALFKNW